MFGTWAFSPLQTDVGSRGYALNGGLSSSPQAYAWTVWVRGNSVSAIMPKRKPITITNPSGAVLTSYPVYFTLTYDSDMKSDFGDLRFTASNGTTLLNYWIESKINSTTAKIWVKVPSLPTSGTTIYAYFGNPSFSEQSSGSGTFELYDDFIGSSLSTSKWGGSCTVSSGICSISNSVVSSISAYSYGLGYALRTYARLGNVGGSGNYQNMLFYSGSNAYSYFDFGNSANSNYSANTYNGSNAQLTNIGGSSAFPNYNIWEIKKISGSKSTFYINNSLIATNTNYITTGSGGIQFGANGGAFVYIDWALIRKAVDNEPVATVGNKENAP
ncbi:MAG: hypothetical protein BWY21_02219 [Parcubacteria group bacterium ADurb.Bin216]|nr:MAG: hypothetical protein BWY21_02219 [Parcubacteria group bacterium ADurb.Bin216]